MEDLLNTFLRVQFGDVRRKTKGALLEVAAFGMIGLSTVLLFVGMFLWLSEQMEPWLAAMVLAGLSLLAALFLMLAGRSLLKRKEPDPHQQVVSALKALGLFSQSDLTGSGKASERQKPGPAIVASALAAGLILGRSTKR